MSNFTCDKCGTELLDSPTGYTTFCPHYPKEWECRQCEAEAKGFKLHPEYQHTCHPPTPEKQEDWEEELADYHYEDAGQRIDYVKQLLQSERERAATVAYEFMRKLAEEECKDYGADELKQKILSSKPQEE